jgi:hypothetical protein
MTAQTKSEMRAKPNVTAVYLLCFHSQKPASLDGANRQFLVVENAIKDGLWPYDNGDDPSFYVSIKGGPLTWGVCRQEVRNSIPTGSIAAFFSFTEMTDGDVLYRLCAVTTAVDKVDVCALHRDERFARLRGLYINSVIRPDKNRWRYDESDRPASQRHGDWLWRIAEHGGLTQPQFDKRYQRVYQQEWFEDSPATNGNVMLAKNYVVFSTDEPQGYVSPNPPEVAIARKREHEKWSHTILQSLTVGAASRFHHGERDYLRVVNSSGRNVHRHIRFVVPTDQAVAWRSELIRALKLATKTGAHSRPSAVAKTVRCTRP